MLEALLNQCKSDDERVQALMGDIAQDYSLVIPETEPEYDETCADDVKKVTCPECGHEFPV
jgi:hypothetical protein